MATTGKVTLEPKLFKANVDISLTWSSLLVGKQHGFYLGLFLGSQSRGDGTGVDDQFLVHQQAGKAGGGSFSVVTAQKSNLQKSCAS